MSRPAVVDRKGRSKEQQGVARMVTAPEQVVVVVLAAGEGRRFQGHGHKLTQRIGSSSVLGMTLSQVVASGLPTVVVTTDDLAQEAARWVATKDVVIVAPAARDARAGMGRSIATGVAARPDAQGWLILPGDMPLIQPASLRAVARSLSHAPVVCAHHRGRRGHPVGFAAELYAELTALEGDQGARRIVARYPSQAIELDDPGVLTDIDSVSDLEAARQQWRQAASSVPDQA